MKKTFLNLLIILIITSCSKDDSNIQILPEPPEIKVTDPCNFDILDISANSTININCLLNLNNKEITLPENIKFNFNGGDIINGTLIFDGGTIDGELLNSKLTIKGSVKLTSKEFKFKTDRWDITEGIVSNEIALTNRKNINKTIELVERLGGDVFELGKMDAYFNVEANKVERSYMNDRAIRIPSDFHFKMSDDTFLRVQPTHFAAYYLLSTYLTDNTKISGGNLIGDRYEHDYSPIIDAQGVERNTHEFGLLLGIIGAHDAIIDRVKFSNPTGDGIIVNHKVLRNPDGTLTNGNRTSERVLIKNCIIKEARRNGISIVDANGITIENCQILDTGKGEQALDTGGNKVYNSSGVLPKYGIDIEPERRIIDGVVIEDQRVENIKIIGSTFKENEFGDIVCAFGTNISIDNNFFDKWVAGGSANNVNITNNTFKSRFSLTESVFAISIKSNFKRGEELVHDFLVSGNDISGYSVGINLSADNHQVLDNTFTNCVSGIFFGKLSNTLIKDNIITSNISIPSYGYRTRKTLVQNVIIEGGFVDVTNRPIDLHGLNQESINTNIEVTFKNVELNSSNTYPNYIIDSKNIKFQSCNSRSRLDKINSFNIIEENSSFAN
ncbi:right-handed parallel beta-helix repeat-containing protein [Tenacibaculum soleae]|uniref:right-handed parallel beta-helix repeat-containing protein n=1 Tax=Tenacibaculum soleae TaxID=447689 RepID=UPI002300113D|nr:right-handed parallel beta-helix repeat-containing protein [Tenacibaculum soleae]